MVSNSPSQFEFLPEYPQLAGGAGRKPAPQITAPAIIQQLAFRIPDELADEPEKWEQNIVGYIGRLAEQFRLMGAPPVKVEELGGPSIRYRTFRLAFTWESIPVEVSFKLHSEYLAVSTVMHWSGKTPGVEHGLAATKLTDTLSVLNQSLTKRYAEVSQKGHVDLAKDRAELKPRHHTIYHEIWDRFQREVLFKPYIASPSQERKPLKNPSQTLGRIFLDIRHLLLSRGEGRNFIALPGKRPKRRSLGKLGFKRGDDAKCVETLMPFFQAGLERQAEDERQSQPVEYTFSRMLGNCIHGSTLGAHLTGGQTGPLTTILYSTQNDEWQLGRWVEYLNALATLRHAILFDLEKINEANNELRKLERQLALINQRLSGGNDEERRRARETASRLFEALAFVEQGLPANFRELAEDAKARTEQQTIKGGLAHRTQRSRYYHQEFLDLLPYLDIHQIGRYQAYKEYVEAHFGTSYAFVRMVDIRLDRLKEGMAALEEKIQTETAIGLSKSAEIAFWQILFPYYWPQVMFKIFGEGAFLKFLFTVVSLGYGIYKAHREQIDKLGGVKEVWKLVQEDTAQRSLEFNNRARQKLVPPVQRKWRSARHNLRRQSVKVRNFAERGLVAPIRRTWTRVRRWPARNLNRDRD
ncbi:MAG: hypothetical protein HY053_07465 [Proteobacteria bacterium]|nr:hypothetical protein [Pseudomonadota bacterium]